MSVFTVWKNIGRVGGYDIVMSLDHPEHEVPRFAYVGRGDMAVRLEHILLYDKYYAIIGEMWNDAHVLLYDSNRGIYEYGRKDGLIVQLLEDHKGYCRFVWDKPVVDEAAKLRADVIKELKFNTIKQKETEIEKIVDKMYEYIIAAKDKEGNIIEFNGPTAVVARDEADAKMWAAANDDNYDHGKCEVLVRPFCS